jgi:uncharacterized protein YndB with AHSA1/START domain
MNDHGVVTEAGAIRFERVVRGPIERVWAYLTEWEKRKQWLAAGDMELRIGGRVELFFRHADLSWNKEPTPEEFKKFEDGCHQHGRITRCDPPRLLSFTWNDCFGTESEATFELTPLDDDEVLLVLTHRRLGERAAMVSVAAGWHTHLGILVDRLDRREPRPFWSAYARFSGEYEKMLPVA